MLAVLLLNNYNTRYQPLAYHQSTPGKVQCPWCDLTEPQYLLHDPTRSQQWMHGQLWLLESVGCSLQVHHREKHGINVCSLNAQQLTLHKCSPKLMDLALVYCASRLILVVSDLYSLIIILPMHSVSTFLVPVLNVRAFD